MPPVAAKSRLSVKSWRTIRSEEHTSELQSRLHLVCRLLLEKKKHVRATTVNDFAKLGTALGGTPTIVERLPRNRAVRNCAVVRFSPVLIGDHPNRLATLSTS